MAPENTEDPAVIVAIDAGRAPVETLIGAVDAALASELDGLAVRLTLAEIDPRHVTVGQLCGADLRVQVVPADTPAPGPEVLITMPAHARPEPRTIPQIVGLIRAEGLASVEAPVPGRLGLGKRLRATGGGSGARRLRAGDIGLRSSRSRREPGPPPPRDLATERAEHLRHRARSSTMRARLDRNAHRLSRERLQVRHERTRKHLAEQRLGRSSPAEWLRWRARGVSRRAAALPGVARSGARSTRGFARRARRFAFDRWRSRGAGQE